MKGTVSNVPPSGGRKHPQQEFIQIDTSNILFILGGAFDGIEKIIEKLEEDEDVQNVFHNMKEDDSEEE